MGIGEGEARGQLMRLAAAVRAPFAAAGLLADASRAFQPHVTVAKITGRNRDRIPPDAYHEHLELQVRSIIHRDTC